MKRSLRFKWISVCAILGVLLLLAGGLLAFGGEKAVAGSDAVTLMRSSGSYTPGQTLDITVDITSTESLSSLGLEETLPEGWSFDATVSGDVPDFFVPFPGTTGLLEFAWSGNPSLPISFTYRVNVPAGEIGFKTVSGEALFRKASTPNVDFRTEPVLTEIPSFLIPQKIYVDTSNTGGDGSPGNPFETIGAAAAASQADRGDEIIVAPGTYTENVSLKRFARLYSTDGPHNTIIDPPDAMSTTPLLTATEGCIVRGFRLTGAAGDGMRVEGSAPVEVTNCAFDGNDVGLFVAANATVVLNNNTYYQNMTYGVEAGSGATYEQVSANMFIDNGFGNCLESSAAVKGDSGAVTSAEYNLFHLNSCDLEGVDEFSFDNSIVPAGGVTVDQILVDAAGGNFHLVMNSPARNAGPLPDEFDDPDGSRNDVGMDGGPHAVLDMRPPVPAVGTTPDPPEIGLNGSVDFDASGSSDEWGIFSYSWDFDSSDGIQEDATGAMVQHTFGGENETAIVTLTVTDHNGFTSRTSIGVGVGDAGTGLTISGRVTAADGSPMEGVLMVADGNFAGGSTTTDANGEYTLPVSDPLFAWTGTVTPSKASLTFSPAFRGYNTLQSNQTNQDFVQAAVYHPDINGDNMISLGELLRAVQIYNIGALHCAPGSEDGYAPGEGEFGDRNCPPYSADVNPQDWVVDFSELMRVIQFLNAGGYFHCPQADPATEDGFCAGSG